MIPGRAPLSSVPISRELRFAAGGTTVSVTGSRAVLQPGSVAIRGDANVYPTGAAISARSGSVALRGDANVFPQGSEIIARTGTVQLRGDAWAFLTGAQIPIYVGSAQVVTSDRVDVSVQVSGATLVAYAGSVDIDTPAPPSAGGQQKLWHVNARGIMTKNHRRGTSI